MEEFHLKIWNSGAPAGRIARVKQKMRKIASRARFEGLINQKNFYRENQNKVSRFFGQDTPKTTKTKH